ncbi:MAG: septal ring lytic transglycosylase RlpA family protein [Alphaproteobacteria bacterium]|nr:septal ring lytic transglycosylase RlpA family protein [Alphaproteobacteria bacterium]
MRGSKVVAVVLMALGVALAGCSSKSEKKAALDPFAGTGSPYYKGSGPVPWGGGRQHVGKPYQVAGRWFKPKEQPNYDKTGPASWYGEAFNRRKTSNGEWFDMTRLTAAHPTLPLPSYVKVTNLDNGKDVVVRVNDRGPFVGPRIIDLSKRTAEVLDFKRKGKANVRVQYIGPAPLDDNGTHLAAMNKELNRGTSLRRLIAAADRSRGKAAVPEVQVAAATPKRQKAKVQLATYTPPEPPQPAPESGIESTYFIQVGSFGERHNAERARDRFASVWPVQFIELEGSAGTVYRVRLGPISDRADADTALDNAVSAGFKDAHLIAAQSMQAALQ